MKKWMMLFFCLMVLLIAVATADEKIKATVYGLDATYYCKTDGYPELKHSDSYHLLDIEPEGTYGIKLEFVDGDEEIFNYVNAGEKGGRAYIRCPKFPEKAGRATARLSGSSDNAYIDELFEIVVEPYPRDQLDFGSGDFYISVGETYDVAEVIRERIDNNGLSYLGFYPPEIMNIKGNSAQNGKDYTLNDYSFKANTDGIYHLRMTISDRNILKKYEFRFVAGNVSGEELKSNDELTQAEEGNPGNKEAQIESNQSNSKSSSGNNTYTIKIFNGKSQHELTCSEEYIALPDTGLAIPISPEGSNVIIYSIHIQKADTEGTYKGIRSYVVSYSPLKDTSGICCLISFYQEKNGMIEQSEVKTFVENHTNSEVAVEEQIQLINGMRNFTITGIGSNLFSTGAVGSYQVNDAQHSDFYGSCTPNYLESFSDIYLPSICRIGDVDATFLYEGNKEQDTFDSETEQSLNELEENIIYIAPDRSWFVTAEPGTELKLSCGEPVTKVTVTPIRVEEGREKLLNVDPKAKNSIKLDASILYGTQPETDSFLITAESSKHYAQRLLTICTQEIKDKSVPEIARVAFVKPEETVNLLDFINKYPTERTVLAMLEGDQKGTWVTEYSHGKKKIDLVQSDDGKALFTAHEEGTYKIMYSFNVGHLAQLLGLTMISSEMLTEDDFAFTVEGGEIAAGQKITFEPVFANSELINKKAKNDGVIIGYGVKSGDLGVVSIQGNTLTAKQNITQLEEVTVSFKSEYCPSQSATATVLVHPKASGIEASIDNEQLYLFEGKEATQIHVTAVPEDALQRFKFTSSNSNVAAVDETGHVQAASAGKSTITVTVDDGSQKKATFNVNVIVPVTGIELALDDPIVQAGKSRKISVTITPEKPTNKKIIWTVAESELAEYVTVNNEGNVSVKANCPSGKFTVLATAEGTMPGEDVTGKIELEVIGKQ